MLARLDLGEGESVPDVIFSTDLQGRSFLLDEIKVYAHLVFDSAAESSNLRISTDGGRRFLTYLNDQTASGTLDVFVWASASEVFTAVLSIYGTATQGTTQNSSFITLSDRVNTGFSDLWLSMNEDRGLVRIPLLPGSKILVTGTDMYV